MKSKRFEVLAARPVNQDGYVQEWPEVGLIAMNSPFDPKPSIKIENGVITELDGKTRAEFDMLDTFIADHAIRLENAEKAMAMDSLEIARMIVDINVSRKEVLDITLSLTPAKLTEVVGKLQGQTGNLGKAGEFCCPKPAFPGHQLPALAAAADSERLQKSQRSDGGRQLLQLMLGKDSAGLIWIGGNRVYGEKEHSGAVQHPLFSQQLHRKAS